MSGLPATMLGMVNRGYLVPGMVADITVFDPQTIIDHSTYERPTERPVGVRFVWVNGRLAVKDGKPTGTAAGRTLLRSSFMPMRPESHGKRELCGGGALTLNSTRASDPLHLRVSFCALQADSDRHARGRLVVQDDRGTVMLKTDTLGLLQLSDQWASITAYAFDRNRGRALTVVVDRANPLAAGTQRLYLLLDDERTYLGALDE
jgi:hypothetical protein